ncbi:MAG: YggS family pyridoxal phosphate-dependent enzyme [Candidatus Omnitrophica bacterium]|nr:YggS family pyridoxal phosphate-dependent enzyme [Candidatus Omnitrophota bacterium]
MLRDNILKVQERIAVACSKNGRDLADIRIVAVTKGRPVEDIVEALSYGLTDIGENRVQEAVLKYKNLQINRPIESKAAHWHMLGHLQTNKVKDAVKLFDFIQSVDSTGLAYKINDQAEKTGKIQDILLEVKTSNEITKTGFLPEEISDAAGQLCMLKNLRIKGLMTIAPVTQNGLHDAHLSFSLLRRIKDNIDTNLLLSMGMTDDFEVAIEEGANILRIGRGIFG